MHIKKMEKNPDFIIKYCELGTMVVINVNAMQQLICTGGLDAHTINDLFFSKYKINICDFLKNILVSPDHQHEYKHVLRHRFVNFTMERLTHSFHSLVLHMMVVCKTVLRQMVVEVLDVLCQVKDN